MPSKEEIKSRKAANDQLDRLVKNKYFDQVPLAYIADILSANGFNVNEIDDIYCRLDRSDLSTAITGNLSSREHILVSDNSWLTLTWYKMESGKYEVIAYLT